MLIIIRTIGLAVSIDYYYSTKKVLYAYFSIGWILMVIATFFPIFSELSHDDALSEFFLLLNGLHASIGVAFTAMGFLLIIVQIPFKAFLSLIIILTSMPLIILTIGFYKMALNFTIISINVLYFIAFLLPIFRVRKSKERLGKSMMWYYAVIISFFMYLPVSFFIITQGHDYGLYNVNEPVLVILNYIFPMATTILLIVFLVHLEYNISNSKKFQLKDKYSHEMGNILQVIQSSIDLISQKNDKNNIDSLEGQELIKTKCKEASNLIREIRDL